MTTPKLIKLSAWAAARYDPPPSDWVLRRWARDGEITPAPERVGRDWYVRVDARRINPNAPAAPLASLVDRLRGAAA